MKFHPMLSLILVISLVLAGCTSPGGSITDLSTTATSGGNIDCNSQCASTFESTRFLCYQACYTDKAKAARNPNLCDPLLLQYNQSPSYQVCLEDVGTILRSSAPCNKLPDEMTKIVCVSEIAQFTNDERICENIVHSDSAYQQSFRADCRKQVARAD